MHLRSHTPELKRSVLQLALVTVFVTALVVVSYLTWSSQRVDRDVVYARKFGSALTMDVHRPTIGNGAGIIWVISGGWYSDHNALSQATIDPFIKRGYTVFAVTHGSMPRYNVIDASNDIARACRYIRHNAQQFGVDKNKLGIIGISSGGHLSSLLGLRSLPGMASAPDPVDREESRVNAVVAFAPPSDFLNYGSKGKNAFDGPLKSLAAAKDFEEWDDTSKTFVKVTDNKQIVKRLQSVSPINYVSDDDPPTLIFHGDADAVVPVEQSINLVAKLAERKVPATLVQKKGAGHDLGGDIHNELNDACRWFDRYLLHKK